MLPANEEEKKPNKKKKPMQEMLGNAKLSHMNSVKDGMQVKLEKQEAGFQIAGSASLKSISYRQ